MRFRQGRLSDAGEDLIVHLLTRTLPCRHDVRITAGDDCAVTRIPSSKWDLLLTSDPAIAGVHFTSSLQPEMIGWKAACRVLSDIAAMGGEPLWMLFNIAAPQSMRLATLTRIYKGAAKAARLHDTAIVGGDLSQSRELQIHAFGVGRIPRGKAVLRSGASPGDIIYVTGSLGGSILGRHASFEPRIREGQFLRLWATSMMDLSDGLASDLPRLAAASGAGAIVNTAAIPISAAARRIRDGRTPLAHALEDGEDFELLFTVPEKRCIAFERAWKSAFHLPCARIGVITASPRSITYVDGSCDKHPSIFKGFAHFSKKRSYGNKF